MKSTEYLVLMPAGPKTDLAFFRDNTESINYYTAADPQRAAY